MEAVRVPDLLRVTIICMEWIRGVTLFMISSMVPIVTKARMVDRTGISKRLPSGLNGYALVDDDDDGEEPCANSGVFPLLFEPSGEAGKLKPGMVSHLLGL